MFGVWVKILKFGGMLFYSFKSYKQKSVLDYPIIHFFNENWPTRTLK